MRLVHHAGSGISSAQIKAARLRWSAADLAWKAAVGANTVRRAEVAESENERAIRGALENGGVEFISENGGGAGVRSAARQSERTQPPEKYRILNAVRNVVYQGQAPEVSR